ncbi:MAG: HEAT repeat domain-containing protein [Cyclobacteriaceae bacterium]|jgi:HEAT repeat protein|nr:HEAT repeat domain-containing protein [Cyclobacteriaceae bacterium]
MTRDEWESLLIDYLDGTLPDARQAEVRALIAANAEVRQMEAALREVLEAIRQSKDSTVPASLKHSFDSMLAIEMKQPPKNGRQVFLSGWMLRVAAALALTLGAGAMGYWAKRSHEQHQEMAALREEMAKTKQLMLAMLAADQPASKRMTATNAAYSLEKVDDDIVEALVKTMNNDTNGNVRLAALEALCRFHEQDHVRQALVESLAIQNDPAVQIALIRILVQIKETEALQGLQKITTDEAALPAVKTEAHVGILRLS